MFDVGFSEILFTAALAVVVLGPERLPELGRNVGKALRAWNGAKNDFQMRVNEAVKNAGESDNPKEKNP